MDIRIGILQVAKELTIETAQTVDEVEQALRDAVANPDGLLKLDDGHGRCLLVPVGKIGYLELGQEPHRQVGFGALNP
ncbi:MAG: DUF3107 domain-containing protein [Actinomycetia bacterium]|nr:DUF3107 domain-containing protein [Actinomycetes bacterium]